MSEAKQVEIHSLPKLAEAGRFELEPLPWERNALASKGISEETINFHYGKHHNGYVVKLKAAAKGTAAENQSVLDIVKAGPGKLFNLAAQHWNHSFYWECLSPNGGGAPSGKLAEAINAAFGSFDSFKEKFSASAGGHFGSGWAWLVQNADGSLAIVDTHDAGKLVFSLICSMLKLLCVSANPITSGQKPLLTCDVWEHAYYIDFRNDRPSYVNSFWSAVNWDYVAQQYSA
jgi:Fe-Mn family superoxide dismutase